MRRFAAFLAVVCICSLTASAAYAGAGCCASKAKEASMASAGCPLSGSACSKMDAFPTMVTLVGEKSFNCCDEAAAFAKSNGGKVQYAVLGEKFEAPEKAYAALACASECYVQKYVSIACEKDGKWVYCGENGCDKSGAAMKASMEGCSKGKGEAVMAAAGGCSKSKGEASMASADGCSKSKGQASLASAEGCSKGKGEASMASAEGCSKSKGQAVMASAGCSAKKAGETALASADCAKAGKFMVAGHIYTNWNDAQKASVRAREEIKKIKMAYRVDGKDIDCSTKVCPDAKAAGKVQYVVNNEALPCELMARVKLAKLQVDAAKRSLDTVARL